MAVAVVLLAAVGAGIGLKQSADRKAAQAAAQAAADKKRAELGAAKDSAAKVLATVEKCESAVTVGVSLDDLSKLAATAREEVTTFERSSAAALMPDFTKAIGQATQAYLDSSRAWFEDNEKATKAWDAAYARWAKTYKGPSPDIKSFRDDSACQKLWSDAGGYIEAARSAFARETAGASQP